jgi:hypothetical protein
MRTKEKDMHMCYSRIHYDILVILLGLTNEIVIFHSCRQWKRNLFLLFDSLIIYNKTWEVHLSQLGTTGEIMAMKYSFHLG